MTRNRCFDPAHRSLTADKTYEECQFKFNYLYREGGQREAFGSPAIVGLAVDGHLTDLLMGYPTKPVEDYLAVSVTEIGSATVEYDWPAMIEKASALIALAEAEVVPSFDGKVVGTQVELHYQIDGVTHHAHLDVVLENPDGSVEIRDWKTSEKRLGVDRAKADIQLTRYALALWQDWGIEPPIRVGLDGLIYANPPADIRRLNPRATKPWHDKQDATRTREQLENQIALMRLHDRALAWSEESGVWLPSGRSSMFACLNCPAKPICPAWAGFEGPDTLEVA